MTKRLTAAERQNLRDNPCGAYSVAIEVGRIAVTCQACGTTDHRYSASEARKLAEAVSGVLGRFEAGGGRVERTRLAALLEAAASTPGVVP